MSILGKAAIAPMLAFAVMFSIATVPALGHGNNPYQWAGVNVGGIDFVVPGDVWEIMEVLAPGVFSPADDCLKTAIAGCGEGRICCYCMRGQNGSQSCFFSCQDSDGDCEPCPVCDQTDIMALDIDTSVF